MSAVLPTGPSTTATPWWQSETIYQIYPRSFADSDGDGVGDLAGIRSRLGYLQDLGVGAIWLSPIYPSPMADFGYDVSDYCDIEPTFGTLADFDALLADAHSRGIRVVLDWVPNHTSQEHPWFLASRSSRTDPKRDWYVWRDPAPDGGPPNDWRSTFKAIGPAWTFDEATGQYYLHSFAPEQPDLNWDNPDVEAAMHDTLRFWLDRGVDGLRLDAVLKIAKDPLLADNGTGSLRHDEDWPTIHERMRGIRRVLEEYPDRMAVAELWTMNLDRFVSFLNDGDQLHLAHNFEFVDLPWDAAAYRVHLERFAGITTPQAWPCWFLENHDLPRVATRFASGPTAAASPYGLVRTDPPAMAPVEQDGALASAGPDGALAPTPAEQDLALAPAEPDVALALAPAEPDLALAPAEPDVALVPAEPDVALVPAEPDVALGAARARAVLLMLAALRGTPFIFEGQELGLPNAVIPADRVVDVDGRDPCRAPVPWERPSEVGPGAGFTTGEPWLPLVADAEHLCAAAQDGDPASTLTLTRRLLALRRATPALQTGAQWILDVGPGVLAWLREGDDGERWLAAINMADAARPLVTPLVGESDAAGPETGHPTSAPVLGAGVRGTLVVGSDPARPQLAAPAGESGGGAVVVPADLTLAAGEALLVRLDTTGSEILP